MKTLDEIHTTYYDLVFSESLAILTLHGDIYTLGTSLQMKEEYLQIIRDVDEAPDIRALLLLTDPGLLSHVLFSRFFRGIGEVRPDGNGSTVSASAADVFDQSLGRLTMATAYFIRALADCRKLVCIGYEGDVASILFGVGLAADFRLAAADMTFTPSHLELGLAPIGGLGYFLPRMVGQARTRDLLYSSRRHGADELLRLGLVDGCLPNEGFREACIERALDLSRLPLPTIMGTKSLLTGGNDDLAEYLHRENEVLDTTLLMKAMRGNR